MRLINADALHDSIDKETYRHTYIAISLDEVREVAKEIFK